MNNLEENKKFKNRILELSQRSVTQNIYTFTNFLDVSQLALLALLQKELSTTAITIFGGIDGTQRQMIRFGNIENLGYEEDFPIVCIFITPQMKKFAENLTHRDYLGALMNLGIEREKLGDLMLKEKDCYLFCHNGIAPFIIDELTKVRHTNVICSISTNVPLDTLLTLENKEILVPSERLDVLIAKLLNLSRSKVSILFQEKKVFVNSRLWENQSTLLKKNDILVIRGVGKFIYQGILMETKKEKLRVSFDQYC